MSSVIEQAVRAVLKRVKSKGKRRVTPEEALGLIEAAVKDFDNDGLTEAQRDRYREGARQSYHRDGEIEIDDNATVSHTPDGDGGAYVQAWVWVYDESNREDAVTQSEDAINDRD